MHSVYGRLNFGCFAVAIQSLTICSNSAVVMPACVTMMISSIARSPPASAPFRSPLSNDANGSFAFHSGCCGASAFTRSSARSIWKYIGCSHQSVPSLSNVAMRSSGGTKSGEPSFVTLATNSTMDCLTAPSLQEGNGSAACALVVMKTTMQANAIVTRFCVGVVFKSCFLSLLVGVAGDSVSAQVLSQSACFRPYIRSFICFSGGKMVFQSQHRDSWCFGHGATHHLPGECFETRLATQRMKPPVDLDAGEEAGVERRAIVVALFQQPQRFLFIAQRQVDDGERIGWDVTLSGYSR